VRTTNRRIVKEEDKMIGMLLTGRDTTQEKVANAIDVDPRMIAFYEAGERVPSPETIVKLAQVYDRPEMTEQYCRSYCAIGQAEHYEVLDLVDRSILAVVMKLDTKVPELAEALRDVKRLSINKRRRQDFTDFEWVAFMDAVQVLLDVEHDIRILRQELCHITNMQDQMSRHHQKCFERGYATPCRDQQKTAQLEAAAM
jgi:transcriptional regulator with XRE-family HTH domain